MIEYLRRIHTAIRRRLQQLQQPPQSSRGMAVAVDAQTNGSRAALLASLKQADIASFVPSIETKKTAGEWRRRFFGGLLRAYDWLVRTAKRVARKLRRMLG